MTADSQYPEPYDYGRATGVPIGSRRDGLRRKIIAWSFVPTAIILLAVALITFTAYQQVTEDLVIERDRELTRLTAIQLAAEVTEYADAVVIGEGELLWPVIIKDAQNGILRRTYKNNGPVPIEAKPVPDWRALKSSRYMFTNTIKRYFQLG